MNKSCVIGLPLPATSAILVCNLGLLSPAQAQENSLLEVTNFDIASQFNLTNNQLDFNSFQSQISSLDLSLLSSDRYSHDILFSVENDLTALKSNSQFITRIPSQTAIYPLPLKINSETVDKTNILDLTDTSKSDRSKDNYASVDLDHFKVQADKSLNIALNTEAAAESSSIFIDSPINQTLSQIQQYNQQDLALESFNKVSNLKDVQTTDWAYNALLRLIERYGCIAGFEDNTFRGNRPISRYEFAAALSSCLQNIEKIATNNRNNLPTAAEFAEVKRLQTEFKQELLAVQTKTDNLEQEITFLEDNNFSPTTILRGQVDFLLASAFGDQKAVPSGETPTEDLEDETTFSSRIRLNFETSFTGRDLLRTRIEGGNINAFGLGVTGTQMTFLGTTTNTDNNIRLGQIFYRFPLGDKGDAYIAGAQQSASAFIPTLNRATTISLFGFNNPLFDLGFGAGGGVYYQFTDTIGAGVTYFSGSPANSESGKGFFNGDFSALGQVTFTPSDDLGISLAYARFFSPEPGATNNITSFTGSVFAQIPFGGDTATSSDNFNIAVSYQISDRLELGGWIGYINANAESSPADSGFIGFEDADADIWTAAFSATYNDLGKLGSKLSLIVGLPPKLTNNDISNREDEDTSLHLELSYNYPLTEKISLIPGVLAITNPEHNNDNNAIVVSLLQTTFNF